MKKYLLIILSLSLFKLIIHWLGNKNYGYHRDELLHLSVSEHMDWGFMEFPPFISLIGKVSHLLFDYSLEGVRLFPTLAGIAILVLCCLIAIELGGKSKAVLLSGICILAFLPFYRNHTLFQPVAFDQFFWTLGFYFTIKLIKEQNYKNFLLLGLTLGLGLMTKYTIIVWAFGILIGFILYKKGEIYKNKWLYISTLLALLIFLPNIIWQFQHNLPILKHLQALKNSQLDNTSPYEFGLEQLNFPFTFAVSLVGLFGLLFDKQVKEFKTIGIAVIVIFVSMWLLQSKAYYVFSIYPVLFAAGAVKLEIFLSKKSYFIYLISISILLSSIYFIPEATPVLSIDQYIKYRGLQEENGRIQLKGDYADMFGWEEQVQLVDSLYRSLTPAEQRKCVLWAENYGEAGALKILGKKYNLPNPISRHGSFWIWGLGDKSATVWISLGNEKPVVEHVFDEVQLVKMINHKYAIGEENRIPLYLCRKPKINMDKWWKDYEEHIFD